MSKLPSKIDRREFDRYEYEFDKLGTESAENDEKWLR
jgi:hypothetical protein